jgi:hypothetical protein
VATAEADFFFFFLFFFFLELAEAAETVEGFTTNSCSEISRVGVPTSVGDAVGGWTKLTVDAVGRLAKLTVEPTADGTTDSGADPTADSVPVAAADFFFFFFFFLFLLAAELTADAVGFWAVRGKKKRGERSTSVSDWSVAEDRKKGGDKAMELNSRDATPTTTHTRAVASPLPGPLLHLTCIFIM